MWALNFYFFGVYGTRQLIPPGPVPTAHFFLGSDSILKYLDWTVFGKILYIGLGSILNTLHIDLYMYAKC